MFRVIYCYNITPISVANQQRLYTGSIDGHVVVDGTIIMTRERVRQDTFMLLVAQKPIFRVSEK